MSNITFADQVTVVPTIWLQDVNDRTYKRSVSVKATPFSAVGDGVTDDTAAIQAALDTGYDVWLDDVATHYKITAPLVPSVDGQVISGPGMVRQYTAEEVVFDLTGRTEVVIDGARMYCSGSASSLNTDCAVLMQTTGNNIVRGCWIYNCRGWAVTAYNSNDNVVIGNKFRSAPTTGIADDTDIGGDIQFVYSSSRNIAAFNSCLSGSGTGIKAQSITDGDVCDDNVICFNEVKSYRIYGLVAYRNSSTAPVLQSVRGTRIFGNIIDDIKGDVLNSLTSTYTFGCAIYSQGAEEIDISHNKISRSHSGGVSFSGLLAPGAIGVTNQSKYTIADNQIKESGVNGLDVGDANALGDAEYAALLHHNTIIDSAFRAIRARTQNGLAIIDNICDTTGSNAIEVNQSTTTTVVNTKILGNTTRGVTGTAIVANYVDWLTIAFNNTDTSSAAGITSTNSSNVRIHDNGIKGHTTRGIQIASTVTTARVENNDIVGTGSSTEGIRLDAACRQSGNRITGCTTAWAGNFAMWATLTANSTTPSVADRTQVTTANSSPTTITNFTGGYDGQEIQVYVNDTFTTLDFTASSLIGNGGSDRGMAVGDVAVFVYRASTSTWHMIGLCDA